MKKTAILLMLFLLFPASWANSFSALPYIDPGELELAKFLAPPPAQDSTQTRKEIEEILAFQRARSSETVAYAVADQDISVFRFAVVLGTAFKKDKLPLTDAFFDKVLKDIRPIVDQAKGHWNRPRPYIFDHRVKPCVRKPGNAAYPSGHATAGNLMAVLLANMVPEKNALIFARGWEFSLNRVIGGVHYRSDIEAGRIAASLIAYELFKKEEFKKDFADAKKELRQVLGCQGP